MLHRTRREGLEGKFCSTDVVQPTRTCTMKNYILPVRSGTVSSGDGGGAATARQSPSVSPTGCHLPMASPQGGIQAATARPAPRNHASAFCNCRFPHPRPCCTAQEERGSKASFVQPTLFNRQGLAP